MVSDTTLNHLNLVFGDTVSGIAHNIGCRISLTPRRSPDELGQALQDYGLRNLNLRWLSTDQVELTTSLAELSGKAKKLYDDGVNVVGNGLSNQIVAQFFSPGGRPVILVPLPYTLPNSEHLTIAAALSQAFDFDPPIGMEGIQMRMTMPQFLTLRNAWQNHAKVSEGEQLRTQFLDDFFPPVRKFGPFGTADAKEADADHTLFEAGWGAAEAMGLNADETAKVLGLTDNAPPPAKDYPPSDDGPEDNFAFSQDDPIRFSDEEYRNAFAQERKKPSSNVKTWAEHSKGVDGMDAPNVIRPRFGGK